MRLAHFAAFIILALCSAAPAFAGNDSRAFPPDNCNTSAPFMAFTGVNGSNTFCNSGQDIFHSALPACSAGQEVAFDGGKFYCKNPVSVPTCGANQFLSFNGTSYVCKDTTLPPSCGGGYVLTYVSGSGFQCVANNASVPVCNAQNQFLTYNGSDFSCANVNSTPPPAVPNCGGGQVVMGNGSYFYCATAPDTTPSGSWCGAAAYYDTSGEGSNIRVAGGMPCQGYYPIDVQGCPGGYSLSSFNTGTYSWIVTCVKN